MLRIGLLLIVVACTRSETRTPQGAQPIGNAPSPDAAAQEMPVSPADAEIAPLATRDTSRSPSRFGFLTVEASARTAVSVDDVLIGETPIMRIPLTPGTHVLKVVGPRQGKEMTITIDPGQELTIGPIHW